MQLSLQVARSVARLFDSSQELAQELWDIVQPWLQEVTAAQVGAGGGAGLGAAAIVLPVFDGGGGGLVRVEVGAWYFVVG